MSSPSSGWSCLPFSLLSLLNFESRRRVYSEVVEKFPHLRPTITEKLISTLPEIKSGKVYRGILWILGEYVENVADIERAMKEIRKVLGEIPILASEQRLLDEAVGAEGGDEEKEVKDKKVDSRPRVLADGTYATESAYTTSASAAKLEAVKAAAKPPLRGMHTVVILLCTGAYAGALKLLYLVGTSSLAPCFLPRCPNWS